MAKLYRFCQFIHLNSYFKENDVLDWFAFEQFQSSHPSWQYESRRIVLWFSKWLGKDFSIIKKKKPASVLY